MPRNYKTDLFQKRQYEWLADVIKNLNVSNTIKLKVAAEFADALRGSNSGYDRERFMNATCPDPKPVKPVKMGPGCPHGPLLPVGARCSLCED